MARPYVTLAEHPGDMVRLACTKCDRRGQYHKATLLERYGGADAIMVALRLELARRSRPTAEASETADGIRGPHTHNSD